MRWGGTPGPPDCGARAHPVANGFGSRMDSLRLAIVHAQQPSSAHSLIKTAVALVALILLTALPALPHDFAFTEVTVLIERQGAYRIDLRMDVDALALGVSPTTDSAEVAAELQAMTPDALAEAVENARQTVQRRVRLRFDGVKQTPAITFPQRGTKLALENEIPTLLGLTARLSGGVPAGAQAMTFGVSRAFKAVHLTLLDQRTGRASRQVLGVGEDSAPYPLQGEGGAEGWGKVAFRYLVLGFQHILPAGSDHILFVLGLFLLGRRFRPLLWQVTAFTLAHSVTLALSSYDLVSLPSRPVESLIALSIAYVAAENIATTELKPWRPAVVFAFGLLHGLGFAEVLRELGLPGQHFMTALVTFNLGVELGQLGVLLLAFAAVGWFRRKPWYRRAVVLPGSILIGAIGLYWFLERAFG